MCLHGPNTSFRVILLGSVLMPSPRFTGIFFFLFLFLFFFHLPIKSYSRYILPKKKKKKDIKYGVDMSTSIKWNKTTKKRLPGGGLVVCRLAWSIALTLPLSVQITFRPVDLATCEILCVPLRLQGKFDLTVQGSNHILSY